MTGDIDYARCPYCGMTAGPVAPGAAYTIQHRGDGSHAVLARPAEQEPPCPS